MDNNKDNNSFPYKSIRLVHLQLLPFISGVQKVTLEEFQILDHSLYEPILICKEEGLLTAAVKELGSPSYYAPALVRPISPLHDFTAGIQLFRLFRKLKPTILHTHSSKTGVLGRIVGRLSGIPVIIHTVHGFSFPYTQSRLIRLVYFLIEYLAGKCCDGLIVLNEGDRKTSTEKLSFPAERVYLIPNGVDSNCYAKATYEQRSLIRRRNFEADDDTICIGMVGRLWRQKNPVCLLNAAFRVIDQTDKRVKFFFIGDGELRVELEQMIQRKELESKIQVMGWRKDVASLLAGLDIFVLPSLWEGMPLAILEAMASSLPVIASDIPGNNDLIENEVDGFIFEPDNDVQFAEKILSLVNDPERGIEMGENGRKKVVEHYQLLNRVERINKLYKSLLDTKSGAAGV